MSISFRNVAKVLANVHWMLLINFICIFLVGLAIQYSSTGGNWRPLAYHQMRIFCVFLPIIMVMPLIKISDYIKCSYTMYTIILLLLISVNMVGFSAMGATRWLRFKSLNLQPSEFAKIVLIIVLASYFSQKNSYQVLKVKTLFKAVCFVIPIVISVLKQPNLGTATVISLIAISMIFVIINKYHLIGFGMIIMILSFFISNSLHDYQKKRIVSFLNPDGDPLGTGYNTLQSQIAIGSGGISGKGFLKGTQAQLNFVPEKQTDFAFTVLSEEWGFLGVLMVFFLYISLILMILEISIKSIDVFSKLASVGIASFFSFHFFINIAMVTGMIPVVGVPLPLLSYGGSITATSMLGIGVLFSIHANNLTELNS